MRKFEMETHCAYDRFVVAGEMKNVAKYLKVFKFDNTFNLDSGFAAKVSDHYPIELYLK